METEKTKTTSEKLLEIYDKHGHTYARIWYADVCQALVSGLSRRENANFATALLNAELTRVGRASEAVLK